MTYTINPTFMHRNLILKEYLPFYIGCDVQYPDIDGNTITAKLSGVSRGDGVETTYTNHEELKQKGQAVGDYLSWTPNGHHNSNALHLKLLLRRVKSITWAEREELFEMVFKRKHGAGHRWIPEKDTFSDPRFVLASGVDRLGIEISGRVWADCDLHTYKYNDHLVTVWFCKRGFDLFNLIDLGLAIELPIGQEELKKFQEFEQRAHEKSNS